MSRVISTFLKSPGATAADLQAADMLRAMTFEEDRTASYTKLASLKAQGSLLAAHLLAVRDLASTDPDVRKAGRESLRALAAQDFLPSIQQLYATLTTQDLDQKHDPESTLLQRVAEAARAGSMHCRLILGNAWLEGRLNPDMELCDIICDLLMDSALDHSWDCLRLLFEIYTKVSPEKVAQNRLPVIRDILLQAAGSGCSEAMCLVGSLSIQDTITEVTLGNAEHWFARALELGNADGGCELARILMHKAIARNPGQPRRVERDPDMVRAREILEQGCAIMHANSHVLLADFYSILNEKKYEKVILQLLATAARLGMTRPYVDRILARLHPGSADLSEKLNLLEQPFVKDDPWKRCALAVWFLHSYTDRRTFTSCTRELEQLATDYYAPACAALAQLYTYDDCFPQSLDKETGLAWAGFGEQLHDNRCHAVHCALILDRIPHTTDAELGPEETIAWQHLAVLCEKKDWLARSVFACKLILEYLPARCATIVQEFGSNHAALTESFAPMITECVEYGIQQRDGAVLTYLSQAFYAAGETRDRRQRREKERVARACGDLLGFERMDCQAMGLACGSWGAMIWNRHPDRRAAEQAMSQKQRTQHQQHQQQQPSHENARQSGSASHNSASHDSRPNAGRDADRRGQNRHGQDRRTFDRHGQDRHNQPGRPCKKPR